MMKSLCAKLRESLLSLSTPMLVDAMVQEGIPESYLDAGIRPIVPFSRMVGTAVTVQLEVARDESAAEMKLLSRAYQSGPGTNYPIIVLQVPVELHGYGIFGEGAATCAHAHGYVGALVEGAARDSHDLRGMDFPAFSRTIIPGYIMGKASAVALNEPVVIGGRTIHSGDVIVGDNDGVVVIRPEKLEDIVARAQAIKNWEVRGNKRLAEGMSFEEVDELTGPMP